MRNSVLELWCLVDVQIDDACSRAEKEGLGSKVNGYFDVETFVKSLKRPRNIIILVKVTAFCSCGMSLSLCLFFSLLLLAGKKQWHRQENRESIVRLLLLALPRPKNIYICITTVIVVSTLPHE